MRGYRYDLRHFLLWHAANHGSGGGVEGPSEFDLIAYRQAMIAAGNRPTTVKCRLTGAEPHRLAAVTVSRIRTA